MARIRMTIEASIEMPGRDLYPGMTLDQAVKHETEQVSVEHEGGVDVTYYIVGARVDRPEEWEEEE